jgi:hypothetical protein
MKAQLAFLFFAPMAVALTTQAQNALRYATNNGAVTVVGYVGLPNGVTNVVIPDTVGPHPIVSIDISAFDSCFSLTNVIIPNSVTNIGARVFYECTSLTSVTIPDAVTSFGSDVFAYCTRLASVTMPNTIMSIPSTMFYSCASLANVTIPNSVTSIGNSAFYRCTSLTNVVIPDSVTRIGNTAFTLCTRLVDVTIPDSVTSIGTSTFGGCTSLTKIAFLGNAPALGGSAFLNVPGTVYYYYGTSGWGTTYGGLPTIMVGAPAPQIGGSGSVGVQSNKFSFTISGVANQTIVVEASTNLVNWLPIWTNRLSGTSTNFTDSQTTNYPRRFYHVQSW